MAQDIVFGLRQYRPHTPEGRRLLTHELVHVIQQAATGPRTSRSLPSPLRVASPNEALEQEATQATRYMTGDLSASYSSTATAPAVFRNGDRGGGQVPCYTFEEYVQAAIGFDQGLFTDAESCLCLAAGFGDLVNVVFGPAAPIVEVIDCACNAITLLQETYEAGLDGGCWEIGNLSTLDLLRITGLAELAVVDCASLALGSILGAILLGGGGAAGGSAVEPGGGTVVGGVAGGGAGLALGDFILDVAAMAAQNLLTQGTVWPREQCQSCVHLANAAGVSVSPLDVCP